MTEEFLYYIWKFRLFKSDVITTQQGEEIKIIKAGEHNRDAGPDFFNAKIKIGKTTWAGNVEIHVNSSDWEKHKHDKNKAYDNIILHVVYNADEEINRKNGESIPTVQLKNRFDIKLLENYEYLQKSKHWIPCQNQIADIAQDTFLINNWLDRMLVERLESKSERIIASLKLNNNNWEHTFYQHLARNFGFKVNSEPFELLAKSLPISCLAKQKDNLFQIEAMLFGQAGMLNDDFKDEYPNELKKEYEFLKRKYNLKPIESQLWKFLRLRPSNFPTIRISQFAHLIYRSSKLFSKILEYDTIVAIEKLFVISCSEYWQTHYVFDKPSAKKDKNFGKSAFEIIVINTIVPFLFVYGMQKKNEKYKERALVHLEKLHGEKNSIIDKWGKCSMPVKSAYHTQALLELKKEYCDQKKCLSCSIGNKILRN